MNFELLSSFLKKYPTKGKKLSAYKNKVKFYVVFVAILAIALLYFTKKFFRNDLVPISPVFFVIVCSSFILYNIYYTATKGIELIMSDPSPILLLASIILFQNIYIVFTLLVVGLLGNFVIGIRRSHVILFNISTRLIEILPIFFFVDGVRTSDHVLQKAQFVVLIAIFPVVINHIQLGIIFVLSEVTSLKGFIHNILNTPILLHNFSLHLTMIYIITSEPIGFYIFLLLLATMELMESKAHRTHVKKISIEQKLRESEQLRNKQDFEIEKYQSITLLAGGIAHDFNNLLTAILGNTELLSELITNPDHLQLVNEISSASKTARQIVAQLLNYSVIGSLELAEINLSDLIEEVARFVTRGKSVELELKLDRDLRLVVDKAKIDLVISNLIINACQAMDENGKITIETRLKYLEKKPFVEVKISDNGEGIPEEIRHKIFDPYFTTKENGKGLGLSSVKNIIHGHNGTIEVESEIGVGSCFTITLPIWDITTSDRISAHKECELSGRILILDDMEIVRSVLKKMINQCGDFDIVETSSGDECIMLYRESLNTQKFDLVITDLTMPEDWNGVEIIRKLKSIDPEFKCVISSGYINDTYAEEYRELGFTGILPKPYTLNDLRNMLIEQLCR